MGMMELEGGRIPDGWMDDARRGWNDVGRSGAEGDAQRPPGHVRKRLGLVRRGDVVGLW